MKAIMVMFDSLNKKYLSVYGNSWVKTPNFDRLAKKTVMFENFYAGSLPCIPARRELHTGRYNFLHRSWGPIEPYDDSMPEILKKNNVYTHLVSDHMHYWEDGGATYHNRYSTWEISRGQEGDHWKGNVEDPNIPDSICKSKLNDLWRQDWVNRQYLDKEEKQPQAVTFKHGLEFIEKNRKQDNWFLQIETFDPHEPFFTQKKYKDLYPHEYNGKHHDWPDYSKVNEDEETVQHVKCEYAALVSMCDNYLGKVLDIMDRYDMWEDTMLIVNTDHGYLLGEHEWWGKNIQPFYNEIVNLPFFIWDPRLKLKNEKRDALVQTIDIAPTLLEFFNVKIPRDMEGKSLRDTILNNKKIREGALFGMAGGHVNVTDGRYVYMRGPVSTDNTPHYEYTLMPTHMNQLFGVNEFAGMELSEPFSFSKSCRLMKIHSFNYINPYWYGTMLFDLQKDPNQNNPYRDYEIEKSLIKVMAYLMKSNDAPIEQYKRIGISQDGIMDTEEIEKIEIEKSDNEKVELGNNITFEKGTEKAFLFILSYIPKQKRTQMIDLFKMMLIEMNITLVTKKHIKEFVEKTLPSPMNMMLLNFMKQILEI
ncbi:sulfatase [Vallitalea longa]|uniref:Sulfatase n=1 Tax=Vallitalea longa TaxID=2936439 RepID=A0A9W5Y7E3_9FIRM|nr:sulfatase [Vallitalea longa]GKX28102.1 sulfatase [Vallitalea longa]